MSMGLLEELDVFYRGYAGIKGYIGCTGKGTPIPFFAVEKTEYPVIIAQYAIHAREHITTRLALKQIERYRRTGKAGTVYFIPAANPDGIKIALLKKPLYKANAFGVDLNVNFDARWGTGAKNAFRPSDENFVGRRPFSEYETRALRDFTLKVRPTATVSYHCKGEEIYYEFYQDGERLSRDRAIAEKISQATGYPLKTAYGSAGGYKDWCIEKLKIPSFTIETGRDELSHPLKRDCLGEIYRKNKDVINVIVKALLRERENADAVYGRSDKRSGESLKGGRSAYRRGNSERR